MSNESDLKFVGNGIVGTRNPVRLEVLGKIRAGKTNEKDEIDQHSNTATFLLHDAPGLAEALGDESPEAIYFTPLEDNGAFRIDLRMYSKNELVCRGNGPGTAAAYFGIGEAPNVTMQQHPHERRARIRRCEHFKCPDYMKKKGGCKEDTLMSFAIPQFSMTGIWQFESRALYTLNTLIPAINKATLESLKKPYLTGASGAAGIKGEIFRMYKFHENVPYTDPETQKKYSGKKYVVYVEHVPFQVYEKMFKDKVKTEDWDILMFLRSLAPGKSLLDAFGGNSEGTGLLGGPQPQASLAAPPAMAALPTPAESQESQETALKAAANDPIIVKLCQQLSDLNGGTPANTEENRIALVSKMSVAKATEYLNTKIAAAEKAKKKEAAAPKKAASQQQVPPPAAPPIEAPTMDAPSGGLL